MVEKIIKNCNTVTPKKKGQFDDDDFSLFHALIDFKPIEMHFEPVLPMDSNVEAAKKFMDGW